MGGFFSGVISSGIGFTRCNCVAKVSNAFLIGSPACKLGIFGAGGCVRMVMISVADCFKKSVSDTSGNGTTFGKKVTVSQSLMALMRGK